MKAITIKARDMRDALSQVKEKLGPDAVILSTRSIRERGTGGAGQTLIEVTACPNPSADGKTADAGFSKMVDDDVMIPKSSESVAASKPLMPRPPVRTGVNQVSTKQTEKPASGARRTAGGGDRSGSGMASEISDIRSTLANLEAKFSGMSSPSMESEIPGLDGEGKKRYSWLLMHGVEEPIARKLALVDRSDAKRGLEHALERFIKFKDPLDGSARVVALVGPTGVGKTTTLAKIAANLLLNRRRTVGMITLDTFRVGAVSQLETYAKLLQIRLVVARSLTEVKAGLQSLKRCDVILVDTVGSSPYNRRQVNSTGGLLPVMGEDREVLLCMAANVRETEQQAVFRRFSSLKPSGLVFTKLDETVTYGGILNVALRAKLPLTFYTDGQRVPENLGWLSAKTMAKWFEQSSQG
ncbi:MAG: flagellar biosynthesis protein FlhF [Magnetococcales bacterium]|nr:flagellar biosynthesis protein FlhF [Magnetococcales bacterium]